VICSILLDLCVIVHTTAPAAYLDCDLCAGGDARVQRAPLAQPRTVDLADATTGDWLRAEAA
jgi:hypothetical protein